MLRELELEQFKAFAGLEKLPVRPITLIYGPNSSGKSSIIQSLLLLKQTLLEAENPNIPLLPKGKIVDLGGYREFVSNHDIKQNFVLKLGVKTDAHRRRWMAPFGDLLHAENIALRIIFGYDESVDSANLSGLDLYVGSHEAPVIGFRPETRPEVGGPASYYDCLVGAGKWPHRKGKYSRTARRGMKNARSGPAFLQYRRLNLRFHGARAVRRSNRNLRDSECGCDSTFLMI